MRIGKKGRGGKASATSEDRFQRTCHLAKPSRRRADGQIVTSSWLTYETCHKERLLKVKVSSFKCRRAQASEED